MESVINPFQSPFFESIAWTLIHSLWQGIALFALIKLTLIFVKKEDAQFKYFIHISSLLLFLLCIAMTFITIYHPDYNGNTLTKIPDTLLNNVVGNQDGNLLVTIQSLEPHNLINYVVLLWMAGMLGLSTKLTIGLIHLARLRRFNISQFEEVMQLRWHKMAQDFGIRRRLKVLISSEVDTPLTFGYLKPIILIPLSLVTSIDTGQLDLIITHELQHIKRHDYIINICQSLMEIVFFFNPFIWWVSQQIRIERENYCDDKVIEKYDAINYIKTLIRIEENRSNTMNNKLFINTVSGKNQLLIRTKRIMERRKERTGILSKILISNLLLASLLFVSWTLPQEENDIKGPTLKGKKTPISAVDNTAFKGTIDFNKIGGDLLKINTILEDFDLEKIESEIMKSYTALEEINPERKKAEELIEQIDHARINDVIETVESVHSYDTDTIKKKENHAKLMAEYDQMMKKHDQLMARHDEKMAEYDRLIEEHNKKMAEHNKSLDVVHKEAMENHEKAMIEHDKVMVEYEKRMKVVNSVAAELIKDGLIKDEEEYHVKFNKTEMYIDDKKQPNSVFEKYKELLKEEELPFEMTRSNQGFIILFDDE